MFTVYYIYYATTFRIWYIIILISYDHMCFIIINMHGPYKIGEMVFAKCQDYPFWPGKIIATFPHANSYKILFYGEKTQSTIDDTCILPYSDQTQRKILNEGNNRFNKNLKHSMLIATKRSNKRKKGLVSSSEEDDYQESEPPKRYQMQEQSKQKRFIPMKTPQDPQIQLGMLLNSVGNEAANFNSNKQVNRKFTPQNQARLRQLLDPNFGLELKLLIEHKIIEKFILVLKQIDLWGLKSHNDLCKLIRQRYEYYKGVILSEEFASIPIREARRQIIIQKVNLNKAVI